MSDKHPSESQRVVDELKKRAHWDAHIQGPNAFAKKTLALIEELQSERDKAKAALHDWFCNACQQRYSGPPDYGTSRASCPKCGTWMAFYHEYRAEAAETALAGARTRLSKIDAASKADADDLAKMRDGTKMSRAGLVEVIVYQQQELAEAIERCAKVCRDAAHDYNLEGDHAEAMAATYLAESIDSLKSERPAEDAQPFVPFSKERW